MRCLVAHAGLAAAVFSLIAGIDIITADEPFNHREFLVEDAPEFLLLAIAIAAASYAGFRLRDARLEHSDLSSALSDAIAEGNQWRAAARVHCDGLAEAIQQQFSDWQLSASERDVAMLMLKGLSHKEIANLRHSSSATVRQQAAAVYAKSGLSSRTELAAYFLEDLFPSRLMQPPSFKPAPRPSDIRSIEASAGHY